MKSRVPLALVLLLTVALGKVPPAAAQSPCGGSRDLPRTRLISELSGIGSC